MFFRGRAAVFGLEVFSKKFPKLRFITPEKSELNSLFGNDFFSIIVNSHGNERSNASEVRP